MYVVGVEIVWAGVVWPGRRRDRGQGKTSADADEITERLARLVAGRSIERAVVVASEDAAVAEP